jgi:hypothetical protein
MKSADNERKKQGNVSSVPGFPFTMIHKQWGK